MSKKEKHPTIFVLDGSIRYYDDGSMLHLHSQITNQEWEEIVSETIKYKVFVNCLKDIACPRLDESWSEEDEWHRLQLQVAVSRMKNIDPLLVAKYNESDIKEEYSKQMIKGVENMKKMIKDIKNKNKEMLKQHYGLDDDGNVRVSKF